MSVSTHGLTLTTHAISNVCANSWVRTPTVRRRLQKFSAIGLSLGCHEVIACECWSASTAASV